MLSDIDSTNFRGIYFRVVTEGLVRVGAEARVTSRPG
jgi:MOSC domain-containing protein YiiM